MNNSIIQEIIIKSILEEASSDELLTLTEWRNENPENENLYQEYLMIWNSSANYEAKEIQFNSERAYKKHLELLTLEGNKAINKSSDILSQGAQTPRTRTKFFTLRRAASIAALFIVAFGAFVVFNALNTTSLTADNGVAFATLEDGSAVWLDEGSSLRYTKGFGKDHRNVELEGKAFFDVQEEESLAFNIFSDEIEVSVLGTSFTVDAKKGENMVSVTSGKVSVKAEKEEVILSADEKVVYGKNNFTQLKTSAADVVWRNSNLSFTNAPLNQVIADINLFHGNKIVLNKDINNLDCPFTARSLANTSFENIIEILEITYELKAESQGNGNVLLTISDCK